jgi:hypothetical protein
MAVLPCQLRRIVPARLPHRGMVRRRHYCRAPLGCSKAPIAWRGSCLTSRAKGGVEDFTLRFVTINGLPSVMVDGSEGLVQTAAFEIEGDVIGALYVVRIRRSCGI